MMKRALALLQGIGRNLPASTLDRALLALIVAVIVAGTCHRFVMLGSQFAHVDDLGVATAIIQVERTPSPVDAVVDDARYKSAHAGASARNSILLRAVNSPTLRRALQTGAPLIPFIIVPATFTYAPLPLLADPLLITPTESYESVKFRGRLPSLIFSLVTMLLMGAIAIRIRPRQPLPLALAMVSPLAFSGEFTIMAAQMHPYAATTTAAALLILLVAGDGAREGGKLDIRFILGRAFVLIVLCYLSYQAIVLLPGYFVALAVGIAKRNPRQAWGALALRLVLMGTVTFAGILPAYVLRVKSVSTVGWNAGPGGEFLFTPHGGLFSTALQAVKFVAGNGWIAIGAMISPTPEAAFTSLVVTAIALLCSGAALVVYLRRAASSAPWDGAQAFVVSATVSLAVLLLLVLRGALTLSPTRHLLVYLPFLVVLTSCGLLAIVDRVARAATAGSPNQFRAYASIVWAVLLAAAFYGQFGTFFAERQDPFHEAELVAMVHTSGAGLVAGYDSTVQPLAMPSLRAEVPAIDTDLYLPSAGWPATLPQRILFVSHRHSLTDSDCARLFSHYLIDAKSCLAAGTPHEIANRPSAVEMEFSRRTRNGANGFFATIFELRQPTPQPR